MKHILIFLFFIAVALNGNSQKNSNENNYSKNELKCMDHSFNHRNNRDSYERDECSNDTIEQITMLDQMIRGSLNQDTDQSLMIILAIY
jgi:2,3-bisphosphoglycerate-independent phosphoglycerate mutase